MASGNAIRGNRVGSGPTRWAERGEQAARQTVTYWCANAHATPTSFAANVVAPSTWDCPRCGLPAGLDQDRPPQPPRAEPYKTHFGYLRERRSEEDGAAILAAALADLERRRGS